MAASFNDANASKALGLRLRQARKTLLLTQEALAVMTTVHHSQISRIERGQFRGLSENVQILCKQLGVEEFQPDVPGEGDLERRLASVAATSPKWARALSALLDAIEKT